MNLFDLPWGLWANRLWPVTDLDGLTDLKLAQDIAWLLLVILTPLWVNLWGQQPFELPKVMLVRTLVWLLAGLILADYILRRRLLRRHLQINPLLGPVAVLGMVIAATTVLAVDWRLSLWGSYERSQGAVTLVTYLLLFVLAATQLRSLPQARQIVTVMAFTGIPLVLISLLQAIGWNPFGLVSDARSSVYATLGRANFLGAYLVILGPLTLASLLISRHPRWRLIWAILLASEIVVVGLTLARSAWLAMAVSLAVFAVAWWGGTIAGQWRALAWSGIGLLFLSGPLAILWLGQRQLGSTAARLAIWQGTLELIAQRPLLGYGADAVGMVFSAVYPPELVYYQGRDFFVDRAHNLFLDWAMIAGIPGLLAFLLVCATFVIVVYQALRQPQPSQKRALLIAILAAVLGNIANNLASFDVTPTATATWLLIGVGVALAGPPTIQTDATGEKLSLWRGAFIVLLFVGIGTAIWQVNGRPLLADVAARSARRHAQIDERTHSIAAAQRAISLWPAEPAHYLFLSQAYWQQALANPSATQPRLAQAESALIAARQLRPKDPTIWLHTAQFYSVAASQFGRDTRELADDAYRQALTLAPNHATIYTAWGRTYVEEGDAQKAAPLLRKAVMLDASNGEAYLYLAATELALGRLEVALADYHEAVRLSPDSGQAYAGLAQCYWQLGQSKEALGAAEEALQRDPQNAQAISIWQALTKTP